MLKEMISYAEEIRKSLFSEGEGSWITEDAKKLYDNHLQAWRFLNKQ